MVTQHLGTIGRIEQIPIVGAHERVDADVVAGNVVDQQRRQMGLVELGRPVDADDGPDGLEESAEQAAADDRIGRLHDLDRGRVVPEQDIGVGAQGGDIVDAADDESLFLQRLQGRQQLIGEFGAVGIAEFTGRGIDGIGDVPRLLVRFLDLGFGGLSVIAHSNSFCVLFFCVGLLAHCVRLGRQGSVACAGRAGPVPKRSQPRRDRLGTGDAGRDPDPVEGRSCQFESVDCGDGRIDRGDP